MPKSPSRRALTEPRRGTSAAFAAFVASGIVSQVGSGSAARVAGDVSLVAIGAWIPLKLLDWQAYRSEVRSVTRPATAAAASKPRRTYHTAVGWWLMTHERGGAAVLGGCALMVLLGDSIYAASEWTGSFPRSFLIGVVGIAVFLVLALLLRRIRPIGSDRRAARRYQQWTNRAFWTALAAFVVVGGHYDSNDAADLAGLVAGLAAFFVLFTLNWLIRKRA